MLSGQDFVVFPLEAVACRSFVRWSLRFGISRAWSLMRFVCTLGGWFGHVCIRSFDALGLLNILWITTYTCVAVQFIDVWLQEDIRPAIEATSGSVCSLTHHG